MRKNLIQTAKNVKEGQRIIENDWFKAGLPPNISIAEDAYLDSSYSFASFHSSQDPGLTFGKSSGMYDRCSFMVGEGGTVQIGDYCILNGTNIICNFRVTIGNHCMISWGSFITDSYLVNPDMSKEEKAITMEKKATTLGRNIIPDAGKYAEVIIEDGAWIGFGSVIMPGVRIGKFAVVGCRSVVYEDVPDFAVVAGSPGKIIRYLKP